MCHNSQYNDAKKSNGTYDFSYVFSDILPELENSDITVGNLETTFAGAKRGYSSYPQFNTPEILATNLKDVGFDILTTANNHSLDTGYSGIESTLNYLDENELLHTGTARSYEEQFTPCIIEKNGLKIAFISFTYGTNGIAVPKDREYSINIIDKELIKEMLDNVKKENPDIIIASMHWGIEYQMTPNDTQVDLEYFLYNNGVDIIFGSHPHVLQTAEQKEVTLDNGTKKNVYVIYSLGNFMSGQTQNYTRTSVIVNLKVTKKANSNELIFDEINYTPIYTYTQSSFHGYKIMKMQDAVLNYDTGNQYISKATYDTFKSELERLSIMYNTQF